MGEENHSLSMSMSMGSFVPNSSQESEPSLSNSVPSEDPISEFTEDDAELGDVVMGVESESEECSSEWEIKSECSSDYNVILPPSRYTPARYTYKCVCDRNPDGTIFTNGWGYEEVLLYVRSHDHYDIPLRMCATCADMCWKLIDDEDRELEPNPPSRMPPLTCLVPSSLLRAMKLESEG